MPPRRPAEIVPPNIQPRSSVAVFVLGIIALTVILIGVWRLLPSPPSSPTPQSTLPTPVAKESTSTPMAVTTSTTASLATTSTLRDLPIGMMCGAQNAICMDAGARLEIVGNPIVVTGTAIVFEQQFSWKLDDASGTTLLEGSTMTHASDSGMAGPFSIRIHLVTIPVTPTGTLSLFERSPQDGAIIHELRVSVRWPRATQTLTVYVPDQENLTRKDCTRVMAKTIVIPKTTTPMASSVSALMSSHIGGSFLADAHLVDLTFENGTATVTIALEPGAGGACLVTSQRAMIERTLKQFPQVKTVIIQEEGKTPETSLQS